jgi:hypothetical protein
MAFPSSSLTISSSSWSPSSASSWSPSSASSWSSSSLDEGSLSCFSFSRVSIFPSDIQFPKQEKDYISLKTKFYLKNNYCFQAIIF